MGKSTRESVEVIPVSRIDSDTSLLTVETEDQRTESRSEILRELLDVLVLAPVRIMWSDWRTRLGVTVILSYVLLGTIGVLVFDQPTTSQHRYLPPLQNLAYPLGTNNLGESVFHKIVHATPSMLKMIAAGAVFSTTVATVVGTLSGYKGGRVDSILTYFTDVAMTIPGLPLVILLSAIFPPRSPYLVGILLTVNAWAGLARAIRSQVLTLRSRSYVEASRIMGVPVHQILYNDILPNIMPYVLVNFVNSARGVIFGSVALYFIGILPFTTENWGVMMNRAYSTGGALYTWQTAHWLIAPMAAIVIISLGLILFAQGTERLFNPRIRARHAKTTSNKRDDEVEADDTEATPW